jgi:hypothetical protein
MVVTVPANVSSQRASLEARRVTVLEETSDTRTSLGADSRRSSESSPEAACRTIARTHRESHNATQSAGNARSRARDGTWWQYCKPGCHVHVTPLRPSAIPRSLAVAAVAVGVWRLDALWPMGRGLAARPRIQKLSEGFRRLQDLCRPASAGFSLGESRLLRHSLSRVATITRG